MHFSRWQQGGRYAPTAQTALTTTATEMWTAPNPNCLVGDNFGGGGIIPTVGACGLDSVFVAVKAGQFNALRSRVFRYAIQAAAPANPPAPAPPLGCAGGEGEIGGNDFISHNRDAGTLMHELGHNLNLRHGGSVNDNCKPNYLSVMNYNLQGGIGRVGGGVILDYSPPRQALSGSTRSTPLGPLVENALNENNRIDPSDAANQTVFMNLNSVIVRIPLNANPNYSGDVSDPPFESPVTANIDNEIAQTPTTPQVGAPGCANGSNNSTLNGDNDWAAIAFNFRQFAAGAEGEIIAPPRENNPTDEDMKRMYEDLHKTDIAVTLSGIPDPVASGTGIAFAATVTNKGPNPADAAELTLTLPVETNRSGPLPPMCREPSPGLAICALGTLLAGSSKTINLQALTPADLVYNAGAPLVVTASASARDLVGTELDGADNNAVKTIKVVAVADLSMAALTIENPPIRMRTGENVVVNLRSELESDGPSSPMDTLLEFTGKADAGATVTPTELTTNQPALRLGASRTVNDHAILFCRTPGIHAFKFMHKLKPTRGPDTDPNLSNNTKLADLKVECVGRHEALINFQPGRLPNKVWLHTRESMLAILTTSAGEGGRLIALDAADIVLESLRFGSRRMIDGLESGTDRFTDASMEDSFEHGSPETVRDGDRDLIIHNFDTLTSGLQPTDNEVCVQGVFKSPETNALEEFYGCDSAEILRE